jgi:predicted phosphodiesterase
MTAGATSDAFAFRNLNSVQLAWLWALPPTLDCGDEIFACHGRPDNDKAYLLESVESGRLVPARRAQIAERVGALNARFVLCGHSHFPGSAAIDGKIVINPGGVGLPAYEDSTPPAHVSMANRGVLST